jgi:uncharacterized protein YndB with AHSA1/START domain
MIGPAVRRAHSGIVGRSREEIVRRNTAFAAAILALAPACALPEVADSSPGGFTIKLSIGIASPPAEVYRGLIRNVGDWWNPEHTFSGNSHNLSIDERAMGCFCEKLPDGGGVRHMEVVYLVPGKTVRLLGALGPLQALAAAGTLTIQLAPVPSGTRLELVYGVAGYLPAGMGTWAAPANAMLTEQFTRLKNYLERGDPAPK